MIKLNWPSDAEELESQVLLVGLYRELGGMRKRLAYHLFSDICGWILRLHQAGQSIDMP